MKIIGGLFRYVLNINTIWGAMILIAFFACFGQQVVKEKTPIPVAELEPGINTMTVAWTDKEDETHDLAVALEYNGSSLRVAEEQPEPAAEGDPVVVVESIASYTGGFTVEWDIAEYGAYEVRIGETPVSSGNLRNVQTFTDAAFNYAETGFEIAFGLVAVMVLFLGLMKVGEDAGIVQLVAKVFYPIIRFLFPQVPENHPANGAILMNVTTTILGLGNAATPFGLKAMEELQKLNPYKRVATDSQIMLLGYNTAGFALLPTTLIGIRKAANCSDPFEIIGTCMVAGAVSTITAIIMVKTLSKLPMFSFENAIKEEKIEPHDAADNASSEEKE
ncbi:MAG: spore maturation protein [Candidatus Sumerlaeota bacterium]|nr:spore maturation protein [Candidatus Sumerlaeota bacterium]